jgi:hypothetical protein
MHVHESRTILFLIMRSQKRLTITIGKIMDLSLERFASVSIYASDLPQSYLSIAYLFLVKKNLYLRYKIPVLLYRS